MNPDGLWWAGLVLRLALGAAVLGAVAFGASRWTRSAVVERWIWQSALFAVGLFTVAELADWRPPLGWMGRSETIGISERRAVVRAVNGEVNAPGSEGPVATGGSAATGAAVAQGSTGRVLWPGVLWLGGCLLVVARFGVGEWVLARRVARGRTLNRGAAGNRAEDDAWGSVLGAVEVLRRRLGLGPVRVQVWSDLAAPVAFGVIRPTIALPRDFVEALAPVQREAQLAHELGHLAGRDPLWRWAADLLCAVLWWHPILWWMRRRWVAVSERVADGAAGLIPGGPEALAESLVALARQWTAPSGMRGLGIVGEGYRSGLARRVLALVRGESRWSAVGSARCWAIHGFAVAVVSVGVTLPGPGWSGGGLRPLWASLVSARPEIAGKRGTGPGVGVAQVNPPFVAPVLLAAAAGEGALNPPPAAAGAAPNAAASASTNRVVTLEVKFIEIVERGSQDLGLDWLFGQAPTNNGTAVRVAVPTHVQATGNPRGPNYTLDRIEVEGQTAVLTGEQVRALIARLEDRGGTAVIAAPRVTTYSGRQAQVAIQEPRRVVTGVVTNPPASGGTASVNYQTEELKVGATVDLVPVVEGDGVFLTAFASVTDFLGYDDPGTFSPVTVQSPGAAPLQAQLPLPRLRVRQTASVPMPPQGGTTNGAAAIDAGLRGRSVKSGETLVLRGPLTTDVVRTVDRVPTLSDLPMIGRLFQNATTNTVNKRLYVFVTPVVGSQ